MKYSRLSLSLAFGLALALTACATAPDSKPNFERYVAQFNTAQPNNALTITRKDGLKLSAREFGATYRNQKPTILLMHGFPDNQHLYDLLIPELAKQYHVISFDFLGWGASDKPAKHLYNVASQRADLEAVVEEFKLKDVILVAHDLSGQPGIDWALDHESKTSALVLLNTYYAAMPTLKAPDAIQFYSTPGLFREIAIWGANKIGARFEAGLASQIEKFFSNPETRQVFVPILAHDSASIRPAFFSSTSVLWAEVDARAKETQRIQQFKKPTHVIFGADDPFLNKGVAESFQALFPNASLDIIEKAGHYVQLDRGDEVARIILKRLQGK
jgi:haloalkane dehalogenase